MVFDYVSLAIDLRWEEAVWGESRSELETAQAYRVLRGEPVRIGPRRANFENSSFFSVPLNARTRKSKAQLYTRTELEQN
jgi:hypothetical protein